MASPTDEQLAEWRSAATRLHALNVNAYVNPGALEQAHAIVTLVDEVKRLRTQQAIYDANHGDRCDAEQERLALKAERALRACDFARVWIHNLLSQLDDGESGITTEHERIRVDTDAYGAPESLAAPRYAACPEDDTCECPCRALTTALQEARDKCAEAVGIRYAATGRADVAFTAITATCNPASACACAPPSARHLPDCPHFTPEVASRAPVCSTCSDTHRMSIGDGSAMCTRCPLPCSRCANGTAPFCTSTPCACDCHTRGATP